MINGLKVKNSLTDANVDPKNIKHTEVGEEMLSFLKKFEEIEEKSKCLRVQFLDWLSDKLLSWSNKLHVWSVKIDSPCVIKVAPRSREESKDAQDRAEVARLKENIARLTTQNEKLWADRRKAAEEAKETA